MGNMKNFKHQLLLILSLFLFVGNSMASDELATGQVVIELDSAGTLASRISEKVSNGQVIKSLKLSGEIDGKDLSYVRTLISSGLNTLDLADTKIIEDGTYAANTLVRANEISSSLFCNCAPLQRLVLPSSVVSIGNIAFYGCSKLEEVIIPPTVKIIGREAFGGCKSLARIELPDSLSYLNDRVFSGCTTLTAIRVPTANRHYSCWKLCFCRLYRTGRYIVA